MTDLETVTDTDLETDTETDTDTDTDTETETGLDTDTASETDADTVTYLETETGLDTDTASETDAETETDTDADSTKGNKMIEIVVADQGWVFVGKFTVETQTIEHAHCIRVWGTSRGLGELQTGPTEKTVLDPMGTLHVKSVLFTMEVDQDAWKKVIR